MSDFIIRTFPSLVQLVYAAALDPTRWQTCLDALSTPFGGANGILYGVNRLQGTIDFSFNFGNNPAYIRSYIDHYQTINPYPTAGALASGQVQVGVVVSATDAVDIDAITMSEFYNDWMKPQGETAPQFQTVR